MVIDIYLNLVYNIIIAPSSRDSEAQEWQDGRQVSDDWSCPASKALLGYKNSSLKVIIPYSCWVRISWAQIWLGGAHHSHAIGDTLTRPHEQRPHRAPYPTFSNWLACDGAATVRPCNCHATPLRCGVVPPIL